VWRHTSDVVRSSFLTNLLLMKWTNFVNQSKFRARIWIVSNSVFVKAISWHENKNCHRLCYMADNQCCCSSILQCLIDLETNGLAKFTPVAWHRQQITECYSCAFCYDIFLLDCSRHKHLIIVWPRVGPGCWKGSTLNSN